MIIHYSFFFQFIKKIGLFIIFSPSLFTIHYLFGSLFTIHYKKGHFSLIIIPYLDPRKGMGLPGWNQY